MNRHRDSLSQNNECHNLPTTDDNDDDDEDDSYYQLTSRAG